MLMVMIVGTVVLVAVVMTVGADVLVAAGVVTVWSAHFTHGTNNASDNAFQHINKGAHVQGRGNNKLVR